MSGKVHVVCGHCDSVVRLPAERLRDAPRCPSCRFPLFDGKPSTLTSANFDKHISRGDLPLVVDFWAPWCSPCKSLAPLLEAKIADDDVGHVEQDARADEQLRLRELPSLADRPVDPEASATATTPAVVPTGVASTISGTHS